MIYTYIKVARATILLLFNFIDPPLPIHYPSPYPLKGAGKGPGGGDGAKNKVSFTNIKRYNEIIIN